MPRKENLFKLIKSLSKTEKRHFKLFASLKTGNSNYVRLFDAINHLEVYDEASLKQKFRNDKFIKQLHVTKNQLTKLILKSLRSYYSTISVEAELNILTRNIEILFRKELFEQCDPELTRALRLAESFEKFSQHLLLITWQRKLLLAMKGTAGRGTELAELINTEKEVLLKKSRLNDYWQLVSKINAVFKGREKWEVIINNNIYKSIKFADSLQSKILFHHLHYTFYITNNKLTPASKTLDKLIELIEQHPHRITDDPGSYITTLNNKIGLLLTIKKYDEINDLIAKVRAVPEAYNIKDKSSLTVKLLLRTYNVELEMLRDTKNWKTAIEKIQGINEFLAGNGDVVPDVYKMLFYYQFSYIYFRQGELSESLQWTNEIINERFTEEREDILSYARFLNLIIHFELKNTYVLRYAVDSTRRFLKKKRTLLDFEKVLLKFFSRVSTALPEKHPELLEKLKSELFASTSDGQKENILDYLDFEDWIDSKLPKHIKS